MFVNTYYGSFNLGRCHIVWDLVSHGYIFPDIGILVIFPTFHVLQSAEVLKMVLLCFGPGPMVIKGLTALGCFHAKP